LINKKPNIIISVPLVWSVRNFILSGIKDDLENYYNIYYFIPANVEEVLLRYNISSEKIFSTPDINRSKISKILYSMQKAVFQNIFKISTYSIFNKPQFAQYKKSKNFKLKLYYFLVALFSIKIFKKFLNALDNFFFDILIDKSIQLKLKNINPLFCLSTCCVSSTEWPLLRAIKKNNIKIIAHILSFDNITSRGYEPIDYFDKYFVWNKKMKSELIRFYNIDSDKIKITGTPQFDFHLKKQFELKKTYVLKEAGLQKTDYILYCANHFALTPNEPALFDNIIKQLKKNNYDSDFDVILRLHPMDKYERWENIINEHDNVYLNKPWEEYNTNFYNWGLPTKDDIILYSNLIKHSSVVLTIASTVSIDAAVLDVPVICLGFHPDPKYIEEGRFYYNMHISDHYKDITEIGSIDLIKDENSFIEIFEKNIKNRNRHSKKRLKLVSHFFSKKTLGKSSDLIVEKLIQEN